MDSPPAGEDGGLPAATRLLAAVIAFLATLVAILAAGCSAEIQIGAERQVSGSEIATEIRGEYDELEGPNGIRIDAITCEEVEAEVDAPIRCDGRNTREIDLEISGEVTAVRSDGIDYRWQIVRAFAPGTFYASAARELVEERLGQSLRDLRCPTRIELREGDVVGCEAESSAGEPIPVELLLTDLDGGFRLRLAGEAGAAGASA